MIRRAVPGIIAAALFALAGCGSGAKKTVVDRTGPTSTAAPATSSSTASSATATTSTPPGAGHPQITIGDKNFTEQFVLGELYRLALQAQGYDVAVDRNIGPTEVTLAALKSGRIDLYPEYLSTWNTTIAADARRFTTVSAALRAGRRYARGQGLWLLPPTPFSDTAGIAVTPAYAHHEKLRRLADLRPVGGELSLGGPPQFETDPAGLPVLQAAYGFSPIAFVSLGVGEQYRALDRGTVQAAEVNTSDGALASRQYRLLADPHHVFGIGNVVPVVSQRALAAEGPAFARTIGRVDALLSLPVIRRLNAAVDLAGQGPTVVAQRFLQDHRLLPATASGG